MSLLTVAAFVLSADTPSVKATISPAFVIFVGYATPSRAVSSAVTCVSTIVQFACVTFAGQIGEIRGDVVAPTWIIAADAMVGALASSRHAAAQAIEKRFIAELNTNGAEQLRTAPGKISKREPQRSVR